MSSPSALISIKSQIAALDREDREKVAQLAFDSLEEDEFGSFSGAPTGPSMEEVDRRAQEICEGKTQGIPLGKMLSDLREYNRR